MRSTRDQRRARGWTQRHLADAAGVHERTVQRLEAGLPISGESRMAIAAALDIDTNALVEPRKRTMFPVDAATLRALLVRNNGAVGVGVAEDVCALPPAFVASVERALRSRTSSSSSIGRLLKRVGARRLRLLAAELDVGGVGVMLAPLDGTYSAIFRTSSG